MDDIYTRQGFGATLDVQPPIGLLVVDFVNAFADPALFGSLAIQQAIARAVLLLREARIRRWPVAYSRVVYANDGADANLFSQKVPGLLRLTEHAPESAVVDALAPSRENWCCARRRHPLSTPRTWRPGWRSVASGRCS